MAVGEDLPQIIVVPVEQMNGASGGFDSLTGTVYLADSLINESSLPVADVLTEEIGHYIDSQLNKTDSPGDEGEHFAALVRGEVLSWEDVGRLKLEDDRVEILDGLVVVEADDSFETATDLGVLTQDVNLADKVGFTSGRRRDVQDWYRFELAEESEVDVTLSGSRGDANLRLYDNEEAIIFESRNSGREDETIETILDVGVYYLEVYPVGFAKTNYNLGVTAQPVKDDFNNIANAKQLGSLNLQDKVTEKNRVGFKQGSQRDSGDYYDFSLSEQANVNLSLDGLKQDANLFLLDAKGKQVGKSTAKGSKAESIDKKLKAGDYYVGVFPVGNSKTSYQLTASAQAQETPPPEIDLSDTRITEGNRGRKNAKFQVTLDAKPDETVRVHYATANQTAKANQDYKPTKGILTFQPDQTRKTITVPILGDNQIESNETFQLNLSKPQNAQLKDRRGIGTIRDNDFAQLSIKDTQITEGDSGKKQAKFTVALNQKINQRVQVNYATSDGTAEQGSDYQQTKGKLTFKPNQKQKTITVPILGDTFKEEEETFTVNLSKPKNAKLGDKRAIGTIKDNGDRDEADGDTFETPINLGRLTEKEVISNDIGVGKALDRDTDDYYRFQLDREGTLRVFLDSLFEDANVELLGSGEELISQSDNDGISEEEIIQQLDPDTYYVRVYPNSGDRTPYRLSLNFI